MSRTWRGRQYDRVSPRSWTFPLGTALFKKLNISSRTELTATLFLAHNVTAGVPEPATAARISVFRVASIGRSTLSTRQAEIAAQVALGKSNREIAVALRLSPRTVHKHLRTLFDKLDVRSRGELIAALYL